MEKDNIFFGESGLTTTSANFVANLAKELVKKEETDIESLTFYSTQIDADATSVVTTIGADAEEFASIEPKLNHIIKVKSLIAWLREGIKAKSRLEEEAKELSSEKVAKLLGIEWRDKWHVFAEEYTEDEHMGTLSVGERNRIFALQTEASTLGKFVHEGGSLSKARNELHRVIKNPCEVDPPKITTGMMIHKYIPTQTEQDVDQLFFSIQNRYREVQAELNGYLHKVSEAVKLENQRRRSEAQRQNEELSQQYTTAIDRINDWREKERHRISKLKIIIPRDLQQVYDEVMQTGK